MNPKQTGYLSNLRVLDASRVLAGPYCGQILGDLGADVVKLERPGQGDDTRDWGPPFHGDFSAYFLSCNRNKRSLALDIHTEDGQQTLHQLLDHCDVLIENFRSDSIRKLTLEPSELLTRHPKLIVCSISGFGRTGSWQDRPGYDFAIQAMSGLMAITGPSDGPPSKVGVAVSDVLTGLYASTAILACLNAREQSGHGYHIDLALLDCAWAAQVNLAQSFLCTGQVPPRQGNSHWQIVPYRTFATSDTWLVLNIGNDKQWQAFCHVAELPHLAENPRFQTNSLRVQHRQILEPDLEVEFRKRTTAAWLEILLPAQVPCTPVWDYAELLKQPPIHDRGLTISVNDPEGQPVELLQNPIRIEPGNTTQTRHPPRLGQHTAEVLQDWLGRENQRI